MNNKNDFIVKFRGTRGSYPCPKNNYLKFGGNTACVEVRLGNQLVILDAGTGIIDVGIDEIRNKIISDNPTSGYCTTIILSHIHQDHIQGLQFYRPLFIKNSTVNLFGMASSKEDLRDTLQMVLFDKVFPLALDEIKSDFNIQNFLQDQTIVLSQNGIINVYNDSESIKTKDDDIVISAYKTPAHPKNGSLSIKIEYKSKVLVYATDKESYIGLDKRFIRFAHKCDCLIHDAQYTHQDYINPIQPKQGFGHSTFEMAIDTAHCAKAKKLFFFHYDPDYDDEKLQMLEGEYVSDNVFFAKENDEIYL